MLSFSKQYPQKRAFITGAASGVGLAFALELAKDGWKIAMADLNLEKVKEAATKVKAAGGEAEFYSFDVSDHKQFSVAVADAVQKFTGFDLVINSAGLGCGGGIDELSIDIYQKIIDVNLMGTLNGCHLFAPILKQQKSGYILNIASAAAFLSPPLMSAYNISKAGVVALSETLRSELADSNVFTTVLMPTYIRTEMGKATLGPELYNRRSQYLMEDKALEADLVAQITLKALAAKELYVVLPARARILWRLKGLLPNRFWTIVKAGAEKRIREIDKALSS